MMQLLYIVRLSIISWTIFLTNLASARTDFIVVKDVQGDVSFRAPLSQRWQPLKSNLRLPRSTLLRSTNDSRVVYSLPPINDLGLKSKEIELSIRSQAIVSLEDAHLRRVKFDQIFQKNLPYVSNKEEQSLNERIIKALEDAWKKTLFYIDPESLALDEIEKMNMKSEELPAQISSRLGEISWIFPKTDFFVFAESYPRSLVLNWEIEAGRRYKVYFWNYDLPRGDSYAFNSSGSHTVKFFEPGLYNIQIVSDDDLFASSVLKIEVVNNLENYLTSEDFRFENAYPFGSSAFLGSDKSLVEFFIPSSNLSGQEVFQLFRFGSKDSRYELVVQKPFDSFKDRRFSFRLKHGSYLWKVVSGDENLPRVKFEARFFMREPPSDYFDVLKLASNYRVYYLD